MGTLEQIEEIITKQIKNNDAYVIWEFSKNFKNIAELS